MVSKKQLWDALKTPTDRGEWNCTRAGDEYSSFDTVCGRLCDCFVRPEYLGDPGEDSAIEREKYLKHWKWNGSK